MRWIRIKIAREEDVDGVWELEKICFPTPWSRAAFEKDIVENILATYMVAIADDKLVGYAGMWVVLDEGHITNIGVHPDYRHEGIATMVIMELIAAAREKGAKRFTLEVRPSNANAIALYRKFGFIPVGYRKEYYEDDKEDAMVMWLYDNDEEDAFEEIEEDNNEGR